MAYVISMTALLAVHVSMSAPLALSLRATSTKSILTSAQSAVLALLYARTRQSASPSKF